MRLEPHRLVLIDEAGTNTKMVRLHGRTLKGQRLKAHAPSGHWKTQTFIAGLMQGGVFGMERVIEVPRYLTQAEAARVLRLSERTLERMRLHGTGPE